MSLRLRLLVAIGLALLVACAADAALQAWRDAASVRTEVQAALAGARASGAAMLAVSSADPDRGHAARAATAAFDGNRHVRASLLGPAGAVLARSVHRVPAAPPGWYVRLTAPRLRPVLLPVPGSRYRLRLTADPANEAEEHWSDLRQRLLLLGLLSVLAAGLCSAVLARALRPLTAMTAALGRLNEADIRLPVDGPPEMAALAGAFNGLAEALARARAQNARLQGQLERLAEEERAEIARDLHDEVGPLLFAIATFAASLGPEAAPIAEATRELQARVRDMLGQLHGVDAAPVTLDGLLSGLARFWRQVRPETELAVRLTDAAGRLEGPAAEGLFRVAQESVSNAVRHGAARHIAIGARREAGQVVMVVRDDGSGGTGQGPGGFGLAGMRARVQALGGQLQIAVGAGWTVTTRLPLPGGSLDDAA